MRVHVCKTFLILMSLLLLRNAYALGPIDGEVSINYWDAELTAADGLGGNTVETGFVHADLWFVDKVGLSAEWIDSDISLDFSSESANAVNARKNILVQYRVASFSDNNFIALGGGLEEIDFKNGGSAMGPKLNAQWRVGLPLNIFAYARAAVVPTYQDTDLLDNLSSIEYELAANFTPFPLVNIRGGYRSFKLDFDAEKGIVTGDGNDFDGVFVGVGLHF